MKVAVTIIIYTLFFVYVVAGKTYSDYYSSIEEMYAASADGEYHELTEIDLEDTMNSEGHEFSAHIAVRFELYTRKNPDELQILSFSNDSLLDSNYDPNTPTHMFVHGWNAGGAYASEFADAFFKKGNFSVNFILVNWKDGSDTINYVAARSRVNYVGSYTAQFIDHLVNYGHLKLKDLVLVGHSLGAHVTGIAGKNVANGKVGKIVALDPALPLFLLSAAKDRLASTDATYVEIIHTNAGILGFLKPLGHADFYPNGGTKQPGCSWDVVGNCAHVRSVLYYIESIYSSKKFVGVKCESLQDVQRGRCRVSKDSILSEMGGVSLSSTKKISGIFYLETNSKPIYSLGSQIVHDRQPEFQQMIYDLHPDDLRSVDSLPRRFALNN